jgi:hypothetical protein
MQLKNIAGKFSGFFEKKSGRVCEENCKSFFSSSMRKKIF